MSSDYLDGSDYGDYRVESVYDEQKQELKYEERQRDKDRAGMNDRVPLNIEKFDEEYYSKTVQKDHAKAAQKFLEDNGYAKDWKVVVAEDTMLMLDYDTRVYDGNVPDQFCVILNILEQAVGITRFTIHESKGGNTHVIIYLPVPLYDAQRVAWQAAFGSDPKREALHLLSISRYELNPILLFMRKPEQKLLGDGNVKE